MPRPARRPPDSRSRRSRVRAPARRFGTQFAHCSHGLPYPFAKGSSAMGLLNSDLVIGLLDGEQRNYSVIANNLANVDTPGYRTMRVRFTDELSKLVDARGELLPGRSVQTEVWRPMFGDASLDGNDVTLEREITELNKNQLKMQFYLGILGGRISRLRAAIQGR
jgi:flagellar basal-body rod protein FlgB